MIARGTRPATSRTAATAPRPATSSMDIPNAGRQRKAALKAMAFLVKRLRFLDGATLAYLADAVGLEQLIRAQAATMDDDGEGAT